MLNIPKTLERQYAALEGDFNLSGSMAATPSLVTNTIAIINEALLKPLSFIKEDAYKASPNIASALTRVSGANIYQRFVKQGPQYYALRDTTIVVPEHLKGKLVDYVDTIEDLIDDLADDVPKMMIHLRSRIGEVYHDKKELTKIVDDFNDGFIDTKKLIKKLEKVMSTTISNDELKYGKILDKNKDWLSIADKLGDIFKCANKVNLSALDKEVAQLADLCDALIEDRLNTDTAVSSATISNIGRAVYEMAEAIRLYGVIYSLAIELADLDKVWQERLGSVC